MQLYQFNPELFKLVWALFQLRQLLFSLFPKNSGAAKLKTGHTMRKVCEAQFTVTLRVRKHPLLNAIKKHNGTEAHDVISVSLCHLVKKAILTL